MKALKEYRIPFLGLKQGLHEYQFELTKSFFEVFDHSDIDEGSIHVTLELDKQTNMMVLDFDLSGEVKVLCDRCGDEFATPIRAHEQLIVKLGDETRDLEEDVIILGPQEHEIDVSQFLYEYANLALPAKNVHPNPDDCNQEVLKAFDKYKVDRTASSQWADLKGLNYEDPEDDEFYNEEEE